jgi:hypothetical protein
MAASARVSRASVLAVLWSVLTAFEFELVPTISIRIYVPMMTSAPAAARGAALGLGRIVALHHRLSTSHQIR